MTLEQATAVRDELARVLPHLTPEVIENQDPDCSGRYALLWRRMVTSEELWKVDAIAARLCPGSMGMHKTRGDEDQEILYSRELGCSYPTE